MNIAVNSGRLKLSRLIPALVLLLPAILVEQTTTAIPAAVASSYSPYLVAQSPSNPNAGQTVTLWVNSDTSYGENVGVQYNTGSSPTSSWTGNYPNVNWSGNYPYVACSYNTSYGNGADWQCQIPAQTAGTSVRYQFYVYNNSISTCSQSGSNCYYYSGFNNSYQVGVASNVQWNGLFSDQSPFFMNPVTVTQGGSLTLRFRTYHAQVTGVYLNWYDSSNSGAGWDNYIPMQLAGQDATGQFDIWQSDASALLSSSSTKYYRFLVVDGNAQTWYNAAGATCGSGTEFTCQAPTTSDFWVIPGFQVPSWTTDSIFYQIFPDRFRDGDPSNDIPFQSSTPVAAGANGSCPTGSYDYDGQCAFTHSSWSDLPTNPSSGADFFGGDLAGITQEIDPYLKQTLGVNALYLNPIFQSPSNNKYDTENYYEVDPGFGTNTGSGAGSLTSLIGTAHSTSDFSSDSRMSVMLDGVFNHTGDWNCWFNDQNLPCSGTQGAYQSTSSPYFTYYEFQNNWPTAYCAWDGYGNLPQLNYSSSGVRQTIYQGANSVMRTYLSAPYNADGWRLDVADNYSDMGSPTGGSCSIGTDNHSIWQDIRSSLKGSEATANGLPQLNNALLLAEEWNVPTAWLGGDQWDSNMNYNGFGQPVSQFFTGQGMHGNDPSTGNYLSPTDFSNWLTGTMADNNRLSDLAMLNSIGTHDTARFLYRACISLGQSSSVCSNTSDPNFPTAAYNILKMAIEMQMTYVGMPSIYYGDEIGMTGGNDPDNRRTFDWNVNDWNKSVLDLTRTMTTNRSSHESWEDGSFIPIVTDNTNDVFAYARFLLDANSIGNAGGISDSDAALVVFNKNTSNETITLPAYQASITNGTTLTDIVNGGTYTVSGGDVTITLPGDTGAVLTPSPTTVQPTAAPGAPVNLQGSTSSGSATFTWSAPTSGGPVIGYNVSVSPNSGVTVGQVVCTGPTSSSCSVTLSGLSSTNYYNVSIAGYNESGNGSAGTAEIQGTPVLTWSSPADITYGTPLSSTQLDPQSNVPGTFAFDPVAGTVLGAGQGQTLSATFTPTYTSDYVSGGQVTTTINVTKAGLQITASSPSMTYGSSVPTVTPSYSGFVNGDGEGDLATSPTCSAPGVSSSTAVGSYDTSCTGATSNDYSFSYVSGTLTINQYTPVLNWSPISDITYGTKLSDTQLDATSDRPGSFSYSQITGTVLHAGSGQSLTATFTPTDATDYVSGGQVGNTINVNKAPLQITASSPSMTYGGSVPSVTPSYPGFVNGDGEGDLATAPTCSAPGVSSSTPVGRYDTSCTGATSNDYSFSYVGGTLTINQYTPVLNWSPISDITYGTKLSDTQLDATSDSPGSFSYSRIAGTVLHAGSGQSLTATFTPTDATDYVSGGQVGNTINVNKAPLQITASSPSMTYGGSVPSVTPSYSGFVNGDGEGDLATAPTCSAPGVSSSTPVGSYDTSCTGATSNDYSFSYVGGTLTVNQYMPVLSWAPISDITYGTKLSDTQLDATSDSPGSFSYSVVAGTVLDAGSGQSLTATFTPTDATDYVSGGQVGNTINVTKASLQITAGSPSMTYGSSVPAVTPSYFGFVNGDGAASLTTRPSCSAPAATSSSHVGTYSTTCSGASSNDYSFSYVSGTLTINQYTPLLTWSQPVDITYGTPLGSGQLTAHSDSPGTFAYTPATGTVLRAGNGQALSATFTPSDATDYVSGGHAGTTINVNKAALVVAATNHSIAYGVRMPALTFTAVGFVNHNTVTSLTTQPTCSTTATSSGGKDTSPAGSYAITCQGATSSNYSISYTAGTLAVALAPVELTFEGPTTVTLSSAGKVTAAFKVKITSAVSGHEISGRRIKLTFGGKTCTGTSKGSGISSCTIIKAAMSKGNQTITFLFAGDANGARYDFAAGTGAATVKVKK